MVSNRLTNKGSRFSIKILRIPIIFRLISLLKINNFIMIWDLLEPQRLILLLSSKEYHILIWEVAAQWPKEDNRDKLKMSIFKMDHLTDTVTVGLTITIKVNSSLEECTIHSLRFKRVSDLKCSHRLLLLVNFIQATQVGSSRITQQVYF